MVWAASVSLHGRGTGTVHSSMLGGSDDRLIMKHDKIGAFRGREEIRVPSASACRRLPRVKVGSAPSFCSCTGGPGFSGIPYSRDASAHYTRYRGEICPERGRGGGKSEAAERDEKLTGQRHRPPCAVGDRMARTTRLSVRPRLEKQFSMSEEGYEVYEVVVWEERSSMMEKRPMMRWATGG